MMTSLIHRIEDSRREVLDPIKRDKGTVDNAVFDLCVVPACLVTEGGRGYIQKILQAKLSTKWVSARGTQHQA